MGTVKPLRGGVRLWEGREGIQWIKCQLRLGKTSQEELGILCVDHFVWTNSYTQMYGLDFSGGGGREA